MRNTLFLLLIITCCHIANAENVSTKEGVKLSDTSFPWELVIYQGKIQGCIYANKFYSLGSILIEETLPRKCELNSTREGYWSELTEAELELFTHSIEQQNKLERESTSVGGKAINPHEARVIRYMRMAKK